MPFDTTQFMLPAQVAAQPDDPMPGSPGTNVDREIISGYKMPGGMVTWMVIFLVLGYVGLRMVLED